MKNTILIMCLVFCTGVYAQKDFNDYQVGHFIDNKGQLIEGYLDPFYSPEKPVSLVHSPRKDFTPGHYYGREEEPVQGYIKFSSSGTYFTFKTSKDAKEERVNARECRAFVIGADSFVVARNFMANVTLGTMVLENSYFVEVMDEFYGYTFYKFSSTKYNDGYPTYIYSKKDEVIFRSHSDKTKDFIEEASNTFSEYAYLKQKILKGNYANSKFPTLIKIFKYYKFYQDGKAILFDKYWDETSSINDYKFYAEVESIEDSVFKMKYYFKDSTKIYDAELYSFYPHKYLNEVVCYFPDGTKRKTISYEDGDPTTTISYYPNGQQHRVLKHEKNDLGKEKSYYSHVYIEYSLDVLNPEGNGKETFKDPITGKLLTYVYEEGEIKQVFYEKEGKRIYQLCDRQTKIRSQDNFQYDMSINLEFSDSALIQNKHGLMLLKVIVEPNGLASEIKVIKSFSDDLDNKVLAYVKKKFKHTKWRKGKQNGDKVTQEIILPIEYKINGYSHYNGNYWYNYHFNHWMNHMNMMNYSVPNIGF